MKCYIIQFRGDDGEFENHRVRFEYNPEQFKADIESALDMSRVLRGDCGFFGIEIFNEDGEFKEYDIYSETSALYLHEATDFIEAEFL